MSKVVTDFANKEEATLAAISTSFDPVVALIKLQHDQIVEFQNSSDPVTPADQARLDKIETTSQELLARAQNISKAPPTTGTINFSPATLTVPIGTQGSLTLNLTMPGDFVI